MNWLQQQYILTNVSLLNYILQSTIYVIKFSYGLNHEFCCDQNCDPNKRSSLEIAAALKSQDLYKYVKSGSNKNALLGEDSKEKYRAIINKIV
ncbi:hypothetical protein DERP_010812 [Dermatophagoides pteronyssinus]|uniref:Uncharacterized protein n=1 Tax=Dermatophagoides pteronyssinus TaxID=6956 RepID=A0ABQ8J6R7_DERPT|nr:hypothetical protein DERP_010812 [Dermatophagoides pteronyssinus]